MKTVILKAWDKSAINCYLAMMEHVDFTYDDERLRCLDADTALRNIDEMSESEFCNGDLYRAVLLDDKVVGHVQVVRQKGVWSGDGRVGCMLVKEATGHGVGTEAVRQMVDMAFTLRNYERLTAIVYHPNLASARMVEKVGFSLEATLHCAVCKGNGVYYDALHYGLLRESTGIQYCEPEEKPHADE